jgi:hypothetical protein
MAGGTGMVGFIIGPSRGDISLVSRSIIDSEASMLSAVWGLRAISLDVVTRSQTITDELIPGSRVCIGYTARHILQPYLQRLSLEYPYFHKLISLGSYLWPGVGAIPLSVHHLPVVTLPKSHHFLDDCSRLGAGCSVGWHEERSENEWESNWWICSLQSMWLFV